MGRLGLLIGFGLLLVSCANELNGKSTQKQIAEIAGVNWCSILTNYDLGQFHCLEMIGQISLGSWGPEDHINENNLSAINKKEPEDQDGLEINERFVLLPTVSRKENIHGEGELKFNLKSIAPWAPTIGIETLGSSSVTTSVEVKNLKRRSITNLASTLLRKGWESRNRSEKQYYPIRHAIYGLCQPEIQLVAEVLVGTPEIIVSSNCSLKVSVSAIGWEIFSGKLGGGGSDGKNWKLQPTDDRIFVLAAHTKNMSRSLESEKLCTNPPRPAPN